jgi:hypothetical protein
MDLEIKLLSFFLGLNYAAAPHVRACRAAAQFLASRYETCYLSLGRLNSLLLLSCTQNLVRSTIRCYTYIAHDISALLENATVRSKIRKAIFLWTLREAIESLRKNQTLADFKKKTLRGFPIHSRYSYPVFQIANPAIDIDLIYTFKAIFTFLNVATI